MVIILSFSELSFRTELRLVLIPSEKCNYNANLVYINQIQDLCVYLFYIFNDIRTYIMYILVQHISELSIEVDLVN